MGNNGGVYTWSKTAASNATADTTVNWQEGQAPSSINDSGRAMMASVAKYRDDISGSIVTTGTSTAYIVSSNQDFDTLSDFNGQMIAFTPHVTNGAGPVTMTVDGFANLPLRSAPNVELQAGVLVQGTPYAVRFNQTDNALYLQGFYAIPYGVPIGGMLDYIGTTAPNAQFAFPAGQAISRATYAALFSLVGILWGSGDGSTTFNLPDLRGRVAAAADNMGGSAAGRMTGFTFGTGVGSQTHTLAASEIPTLNISGTGSASVSFGRSVPSTGGSIGTNFTTDTTAGNPVPIMPAEDISPISSASGSASVTGSTTNTGGAAHSILQPTLATFKIVRIL